MQKKTTDGSTNSVVEVQVQHIMRSAAEKIYGAIREYNRDPIAITAGLVSLVMTEALKSLSYLKHAYDCDDDDYPPPSWKVLSG